MFRIKQLPDDFVVNEMTNVKISDKGRYCYFWLKKKDFTTEDAITAISYYFKIPRKRFGYAGSKDKNAVARQLCSVLGRIRDRKLESIEIEVAGYGNEPVCLGDLEGNEFVITVRDTAEKPKRISRIINFFDEQRFGRNNAGIGLAVVKRDFKKAVELVSDSSYYKKQLADYLTKNRNDYVNALRLVPKKIRVMYVHALQSKIWNETAERFANTKKNITIPIIGFATEIKDKKIGSITDKILSSYNINSRDFIIREMPELSSEGSERQLFAAVKNLKVGGLEGDELNAGRKKCIVSFSLQKGSYATLVIKGMFS